MSRREGVYRCGKCDGPHTTIGRHDVGGLVTPADRPEFTRKMLAAFAEVKGHASLIDLRAAICEQPAVLDGRSRETRAYRERQLEMFYLSALLAGEGLLRIVEEPCGEFTWGYAITAAGRARLAWTKEIR